MRLLLIVVLSVGGAACGSSKSEPDPDPTPEPEPEAKPPPETAEWPGCQELKAKLGDAADVVFSPPPKLAKPGSRWTVQFLGLGIAIPQGEYEVTKRADSGSVSAILQGDGTIISLIKDPPLETLDDVFQVAGEVPSAEGRVRTKQFFGRAPTLHDLAVLGYQHTRADLTCADARRDEETMIAAALTLKTTAGPGELVAVHRDRTGVGDIVHVRKTADGWMWEAQIPTPEASYTIGYRSSARGFLTIHPWGEDSAVTAPAALQKLTD